MVVENKPEFMLRIGFLHSENSVIILILLLVHHLFPECFTVGELGVEKTIPVIRDGLEHHYLIYEYNARRQTGRFLIIYYIH